MDVCCLERIPLSVCSDRCWDSTSTLRFQPVFLVALCTDARLTFLHSPKCLCLLYLIPHTLSFVIINIFWVQECWYPHPKYRMLREGGGSSFNTVLLFPALSPNFKGWRLFPNVPCSQSHDYGILGPRACYRASHLCALYGDPVGLSFDTEKNKQPCRDWLKTYTMCRAQHVALSPWLQIWKRNSPASGATKNSLKNRHPFNYCWQVDVEAVSIHTMLFWRMKPVYVKIPL